MSQVSSGNYVTAALLFSWHCSSPLRGSVHTTPEEFENGGFTLKTHQMLSVHTTREKFGNTTNTVQFGLVFE